MWLFLFIFENPQDCDRTQNEKRLESKWEHSFAIETVSFEQNTKRWYISSVYSVKLNIWTSFFLEKGAEFTRKNQDHKTCLSWVYWPDI